MFLLWKIRMKKKVAVDGQGTVKYKRNKLLCENFEELKKGGYRHKLAKKDKMFGILDRECRCASIDYLKSKLYVMNKGYNRIKNSDVVSNEVKREWKCKLKIVRDWLTLKIAEKPIYTTYTNHEDIKDGYITVVDSNTGYDNIYIAFGEDENSITYWNSNGYIVEFQPEVEVKDDETDYEYYNEHNRDFRYKKWCYWSSMSSGSVLVE
jgi:hypothetical protein